MFSFYPPDFRILYAVLKKCRLSAIFKMKNTGWIEVDFNNWKNNKLYKRTFDDIKSAILDKNIVSFMYFNSVEDTFKSAKTTAEWEMKLTDIAKGKTSKDKFLREIEAEIKKTIEK